MASFTKKPNGSVLVTVQLGKKFPGALSKKRFNKIYYPKSANKDDISKELKEFAERYEQELIKELQDQRVVDSFMNEELEKTKNAINNCVVSERYLRGLNSLVFSIHDSASYVYFIQNGLGQVKIGITHEISKRIENIKTGNAFPTTVAMLIACDNDSDAKDLESYFHKLFSKYRLEGEWFSGEKVYEFIDSFCVGDVCKFLNVQISKDFYRKTILDIALYEASSCNPKHGFYNMYRHLSCNVGNETIGNSVSVSEYKYGRENEEAFNIDSVLRNVLAKSEDGANHNGMLRQHF